MIEDNFEEAVKRSDYRSDIDSGDRVIEGKQDDAEIRNRSGSGPNTSSDDGVAEEDAND